MPRIYLDTSHLSILAKAAASGENDLSDFVQALRTVEGEIVISRTHLMELRQHQNPKVRADVYAALEMLLPMPSDVITREPASEATLLVPAKEVLRHLFSLDLLALEHSEPDRIEEWRLHHLEVFPSRLESRADIDVVRLFEESVFGVVASLTQAANRISAEADRRVRGKQYDRPRLEDLSDSPQSEAEVQRALAALEEAGISDADARSLFPGMSPAEARSALAEAMEPLRQMIRRSGEIGSRQAYTEALGLSDSVNNRLRLDEISDEMLFTHHVDSALSVLDLSESDSAELRSLVKPSDCPGYWLARSLSLEMRKAEPEPKASNSFDVDHVTYAPYTDVFFTDKRVAGYISAIRRRHDSIESVRTTPRVISTAASVDSITAAITGL